RCVVETGGRRLGCAEVPSLGHRLRDLPEGCGPWGRPGPPNNGLTLFIAKSEGRQTLVNPWIAASSPCTSLTCRVRQRRDDGDAAPRGHARRGRQGWRAANNLARMVGELRNGQDIPGDWLVPRARGPVRAVVHLPGSKSMTNRALVLAALSDRPTLIT